MSSTLYSYRNLIYTYCRRLNVVNKSFCNVVNTRAFTTSRKLKSEPILLTDKKLATRRHFSGQANPDNESSKRSYTPLMEYPEVIWPTFFQMASCWLKFQFRVIPLDTEFNIIDFMDGTRHAVCTVSEALSIEDYDSLEGLVTPETIEVLKRNISPMSEEQKKEISLNEKEYCFAFPADVNVRDAVGQSSKIVEVLMVYHFVRNWKDMQFNSKLTGPDPKLKGMDVMSEAFSHPDYPKHAIIGNYRFIREFSSGVETSWSVNLVNQFRLSDVQ